MMTSTSSYLSGIRPSFPLVHYRRLKTSFSTRKISWIFGKGCNAALANGNEGIEVLYDDGYGKFDLKEQLSSVTDLAEHDGGGPPRWLCPLDCGMPLRNAPILLFLPGIDGVGLGLALHHKALGRFFEVRCMHVPVCDRTSFEGLLEFVEETLELERSRSRARPIYLVGHSFGGCLALSVAARNPEMDLVLILSNPATSFDKSHIQPLLPILNNIPVHLSIGITCLLSFDIGIQAKMNMGSTRNLNNFMQALNEMSRNLSSLLMNPSNLLKIIPGDTFKWKVELVRQAANYANSRLHAVKAEVLVLSSGLDGILPSKDEAKRLAASLSNCKIYMFAGHGHNLLMEEGVHLLTLIKGFGMYRRSRMHDEVLDYIPPSVSEQEILHRSAKWLHQLASPVFLSTLDDGKIVRSLDGIPSNGPVILVGNHMLLGAEVIHIFCEFLQEKRVVLRGLGHPILFPRATGGPVPPYDFYHFIKVFGGVPVSVSNMYKLLSSKSFILLYPGGAREALHGKGEEHKLFWPNQPEFVRWACKFGATIVPFGAVGEDDKLLMDYGDMMNIPSLRNAIKESNQHIKHPTSGNGSEVRNREIFLPFVLPKFHGRYYFLFGKPIRTEGMKEVLSDRQKTDDLYLQIKTEVERSISYLMKKREEDKYRNALKRYLYKASNGSDKEELPTFEL